MELFLLITAFVSFFLILYPLAVYPLLLWIFGGIINKKVKELADYMPEITFIVAAHNEEELIEDCIRSIFNSEYPVDKIKVICGSDGSTDKTVEILDNLKIEFPALRIFQFNRAGKNKVINELYLKADTELLGFLDADCRLEKKAIAKAAAKFADDSVGMVMSAVNILIKDENRTSGAEGESIYQKYESFLRRNETKIHSNINSLGSFVALRTELMNELPGDKVCDDFYIILNSIHKGKRVIYDSNIITYEVREKNLKFETSRRIRLVSGGLATIASKKALLSPKYGWSSFFLWSHKTLRWFLPFYIIIFALCSFALAPNSQFFQIISLAIIAFAILSLIAVVSENKGSGGKFIKLLAFFAGMNIGFVKGIFRFFRGEQNAAWDRTGLKNIN